MRILLFVLCCVASNAWAIPYYLHGIWVGGNTFIPPRADGYSGSSYELVDEWHGFVMANETFSLYDVDYDMYIPNGVFAHLWNPRGEEITPPLHWLGSDALRFLDGGYACFSIPGGADARIVVYSTRSGKSSIEDRCIAPLGLPEPNSLALLLIPGLIWVGRKVCASC